MGDNHVLISELFRMHPRAHEKVDRGVTGFMVRVNDFYGALTRGFHVIHDDGCTTAFSYLPCMNANSDAPSIAGAARAAIMMSQREILREAFRRRETIPCAYCPRELTKDKAHIHHEPPKFRAILDAFISANGEPKITNALGLGDAFADPLVRLNWIRFHDARAVRVAVCAPCNYAAERKACT